MEYRSYSLISSTDISQLHSVTAVLQARAALQQGERFKMLAYLATLYLPLTATAVRNFPLFTIDVLKLRVQHSQSTA